MFISYMFLQVTLFSTFVVTIRTTEWLITSVCSLMIFQTTCLTTSIIAVRAFEWFFTGVSPLMAQQPKRASAFVITEWAFKWLITGVGSLMCLQRTWCCTFVVTFWAFIWFITCMNSFVYLQWLWQRKSKVRGIKVRRKVENGIARSCLSGEKSFMPLEKCAFSSSIYTWRTTICIKKDVAMLILCYFCYHCTVLQSLFYWQFLPFLSHSLKMGEETQKLWRTSKSVGSPPPMHCKTIYTVFNASWMTHNQHVDVLRYQH